MSLYYVQYNQCKICMNENGTEIFISNKLNIEFIIIII